MVDSANPTSSQNRRQFLATAAVGSGVGVLSGCLGGNGGDEIVIGGLQPYSGPFAEFAARFSPAVEFALEEINEDGGVLGRDLVHESVDTESNPSEAATIASRLVERDGAVALVGPVSSDVAITVSSTVEELEVPVFLHAAGDHEILTTDDRYTFRVGHLPAPPTIQTQAEIVEERGFDSIGAIVGDYAWGHAVQAAIEEYFPDGSDVDVQVAPMEESDFTPYLRDFPDDLEFMIGSGHPVGVHNMYNQMYELGMEPELFTAGLQEPNASFDAVGEQIADSFAFFHQPDVQSEAYAEIGQRYYEDVGEHFGPTEALGYTTAQLIAAGIEEADSDDPTDISDAMRTIEFDHLFPTPIEYTEWGELDNQVQTYSGFELGAPDYYPDGEFSLVEVHQSEPLAPFNPDETDIL